MRSLIVRGVDEVLIRRLKGRAVSNGRSAEAEHREILRQVLIDSPTDMSFGDLRGQIHIPPDFDETPEDIIDAMENGSI